MEEVRHRIGDLGVEVITSAGRVEAEGQSIFIEIWTQHHVYSIDRKWQCVAVRSHGDESMDDRNPCVGAILIGGQRRLDPATIERSNPLPRVGGQALFLKHGTSVDRHYATSAVTRVLIHQLTAVSFTERPRSSPADVPPRKWDDATERLSGLTQH